MASIIEKILGNNKQKQANKATAWMHGLDDLGDLNALKLCTQKLAQSIDEETLSVEQKLNLMVELETRNENRSEKLSKQFAHLTSLKPELESSMYETCYAYHRQSYIFHLKVLEKVINPSQFALTGTMPVLIIARALNAAFKMCKWRMFMQQNPPTKVWLQTYTLYKIAAKQDLLKTPIELFPMSPATTLSGAFAQIWMLGQLTQTNIEKEEVEIAAKVIKAWLTHTHISDKDTMEEYLFYIDLERDFPAKRMRNFEPNKDCRYWALDAFEKQLNIAITTSDRGEMPDSLMFAKIEQVKKLNETLNIMLDEWRKNDYVRQRRREAREATSKTARVKAGIDDICEQVLQANQVDSGIKLSKSGKTLEQLIRGHTVLKEASSLSVNSGSLDTWILTDHSNHGFGARVNKYANIRSRKDKLISLVIDGEPEKAIVGTIRGAKPTHKNQLKVGIEVISRNAKWIQLQRENKKSTFAADESDLGLDAKTEQDLFSGIYLPKEKGLTEQASIIVPKLHFLANVEYTIYIAGKAKKVQLTSTISSEDDWVQIKSPI